MLESWAIALLSLATGILSAVIYEIAKTIAKNKTTQKMEKLEQQKQINKENADKIRQQELENKIEQIIKAQTDPILEIMENLEEGDVLQKHALMALLKDRLHGLFKMCNDRGYTGEYERLNFEKMFENYTALGGNGEMHDISRKFMNLPLNPPKTYRRLLYLCWRIKKPFSELMLQK